MNASHFVRVVCLSSMLAHSPFVAADDKVQVFFQVRCALGTPTELKITDVEGHSIALTENKCLNKSFGKQDFLDQGEGTLQVLRDYIKGTGKNEGYLTLSKGGDVVIVKFAGHTVTTPTVDGTETQFSGDWVFVSGTGQYQSVKSGAGIWSGRRVSASELETSLVGTLAR